MCSSRRARVVRPYALSEGAMRTLEQRVRIEQSHVVLVGVTKTLDGAGRLVVDVDGVEMTFATGEVVNVRDVHGE